MLDFPNSPSVGQTFVSGNTTWVWDGTKWVAAGTTGASSIYLPLTGGTLSGPLTVSAPTSHIDNAIIGATTPAAASVTSLNGGPLAGQRNRIINGDMRIDQRNAGASGPAVGVYTIDRWQYNATQAAKGLWSRANFGALGFPYALQFSSSSAFTPAAGDTFYFVQPIEADNVSDLQWGTANAQPVTLSFIVMSTLTGTFGGSVKNAAGTRSYPFTFSIPVASAATRIAVTIPGDTAGTWVTSGNAASIWVIFDLGTGATYRGPAGAWASANYNGVTGAVNVVATNGALFYVTGVQLEPGSVATPFERRLIGTELALCQRYYQRYATGSGIYFSGYASAGPSGWSFILSVPLMRSAPTMTIIGSWNVTNCGQPTVPIGPSPYAAPFTVVATAAGAFNAYTPANTGYDLAAEL